MERQEIKEIMEILMESSLYFSLSPRERLEMIRGLVAKLNQC